MFLLPDSNGGLWVGTYAGGLNYYNPNSETFKRYVHDAHNTQSTILGNTIASMVRAPSGHLWIASWQRGLNCFNPASGKWTAFQHIPADTQSIPSNKVYSTAVSNRFLWVGTWNGAVKLPLSDWFSGKFKRIRYVGKRTNQKNEEKISFLLPLQEGTVLAGTWGGGLNLIDSEKNIMYDAEIIYPELKILSGNTISYVLKDEKSLIWIATLGNGLIIWDRARKKIYHYKRNLNDPSSISSNNLLSLKQDNSGRMWIGCANGISTVNPGESNFTYYRYSGGGRTSLDHPDVRAIVSDPNGGLWIGTNGGGLNYKPKGKSTFIKFRHNPTKKSTLASDNVFALLLDKQNQLWIGFSDAGLNKLDLKKQEIHPVNLRDVSGRKISSVNVSVIYEDREGYIWIAKNNGEGLIRYNPDTDRAEVFVEEKDNPHSLSGNWIHAIYQDHSGNIWLGTWGAGLNRFDKKRHRFHRYLHQPGKRNGLKNNSILTITEGSMGELWVGTFGGGINIYNAQADTFSHLTTRHGLANDVVYGILQDNAGNMWCSTNQGLSMYNVNTGFFMNYELRADLYNNEFNQGAYFKDAEGIFYFGGLSGLIAFRPDDIKKYKYESPIQITRFTVRGEDFPIQKYLSEKKKIILEAHRNNFSFEAAVLDYSASERNRYAYFLEGFDEQWNDYGTRRFISYTSIDPGSYIFKVKGANSSGVWNTVPIQLSIVIKPPIWRTWWFLSTIVLVALGMVSGFIYYRIHQILAISRLRSQIAADLHDDIGAGLTEISILNEIVAQKLPDNMLDQIRDEFQQIGEKSRMLIEKMSDIVWLVNPQKDSLHDLIYRLSDSVRYLLIGKNMSYRTENIESIKNISLTMKQRQHLYLIMKEAIHNAIKHSKATEIFLRVCLDKNVLKIEIADNGQGFKHGHKKISGNGLVNMKQRAKELNGLLHIMQNGEGKGTVVHLSASIR
ncbi:MAG TPA: hypothetical protein EYP36_06605 [Calditrichaeota bacterium]|nr:hypothetical protein [Calditrichota bacterium]